MKRTSTFILPIILPFLLFICLFFFVPLFFIISSSFHKSSGWTLANYKEVLANEFIQQAFLNSIGISFVSSIFAIVITIFAVYSMTRFSVKLQEQILVICNLTSNFAGVPLAFAFIVLLGNSGLFTILLNSWGIDLAKGFNLYSWWGLILIYIYFQLPLSIMFLYPVYHGIQQQWKEAAALLGATPLQFWLRIGIPFMLPSLAGTVSILFANAMGAYASAYALTGSNYNLVSIRIGALLTGDIFARPELASVIAVLLGLTLVIAMVLNEMLTKKVRRDLP